MAQEDLKQRRAKVLQSKTAVKRPSNRYLNGLCPLITSPAQISEMMKKQGTESAEPNSAYLQPGKTNASPVSAKQPPIDYLRPVDLLHSPMCKRRATLKLAFAEAANLHKKIRAYAATLPDKDKVECSSGESTPTSPAARTTRHMPKEIKAKDQGEKTSSFKRLANQDRCLKEPADLTFGKLIKLKINVPEALPSSTYFAQQKRGYNKKCSVYKEVQDKKPNNTLLKYATNKLKDPPKHVVYPRITSASTRISTGGAYTRNVKTIVKLNTVQDERLVKWPILQRPSRGVTERNGLSLRPGALRKRKIHSRCNNVLLVKSYELAEDAYSPLAARDKLYI